MGVVLVGMPTQNAWLYFRVQAGDYRYRWAYGAREMAIGRKLNEGPSGQMVYLEEGVFAHPTVCFLTFGMRDRVRGLGCWDRKELDRLDRTNGLLMVVPWENQELIRKLKEAFPQGIASIYIDYRGEKSIFFLEVPSTPPVAQ